MVVGDGLHSLLDELVSFILETLSVTVFTGVDTSAMVVILRGWRGRPIECEPTYTIRA
jgi:hypothetical protein